MLLAIGEVIERLPSAKAIRRGTAFAVSRRLALTAFHVVGDRTHGKTREGPFEIRFLSGQICKARFVDGDSVLDFALLSLESSLADDIDPLPLTVDAQNLDEFCSKGFPPLTGVDSLSISGSIRDLKTTIFGGVPAIQLSPTRRLRKCLWAA
jgi:hypothetical protein